MSDFLMTLDGDPGLPPCSPVVDADGDLHCPICGRDDLDQWADDGEADLADWWTCNADRGGCGSHGALVLASDPTRTQNGLAVGSTITRRYFVARFDVTGLSQGEIDRLAGEVVCQGERSKPMDDDDPGHPDVRVETEIVEVPS